MSSRTIKKSILFNSNSTVGSDVQYGGGKFTVAGLDSVRFSAMTSITNVKYRAEVAQVVTIGGTTFTPTGGTKYTIAIGDPLRTISGVNQAPVKLYAYVTPPNIATLGATEALQREAIYGQLVTKINLDSTNYVVAASVGGGAGITITDDGGYYPVYAQNMSAIKGASEVYPVPNSDGTGFADNNVAVTTAAVYSFGVGAKLASEKPVVNFTYGNIVSGIIEAPPVTSANAPAVSGQKYDGFIIEDLKIVDGITLGGQLVYQTRIQTIYADNGTGTSTSNLTNFLAFQKEMHKIIYAFYKHDNCTVAEFFDRNFVIQGPLGAVPATTTSLVNKFMTSYGTLQHTNIGTQTIVAPTQGTTGLLTDQDVATGEGAEYYVPTATPNSQQFVVGKTEAILIAGFTVTAVTGANCLFGFRSKEAFQLDYNDYQNLGAIGFTSTSGKFSTAGILANAATVTTTSSSTGATNSVRTEFVIKVDIDGYVTCYANGVSYPIYSAGTTALKFAAGTVLIPFFLTTQITGTASVGVMDEFLALPNKEVVVF